MKKYQNFNYHTHTYRCGHADDSMKDIDYVEEFIKKGFKKIAFTDHCPDKNNIDKRSYMRMNYSDKEEYLNSIKLLKEKYKDKIEIESGYEVEYLPGNEDSIYELKNEVDKIVLGQHFIYDDNNNLKIFRYDNFTDSDLIKYATYIDEALSKNIPDIVVHPDLFMLNRDFFGPNEKKVSHMICSSAEKYNVPLEINLEDICFYLNNHISKVRYPSKDFWEIVSDYNIKVVYGIDAHFKEQIRDYEKCIDFANNLIGEDVIEKLNFIENIGE